MARPTKTGLDYFPHDTDAVSEEKVEAMRALFKNDGYAFYFILLERIYCTQDGLYPLDTELKLQITASKIGVSKEILLEMIEASLEIGLFDRCRYDIDKCLTSKGILKRFGEVDAMREKWRAKKGIIKELSPEITGKENPESKAKKSKEKQIEIEIEIEEAEAPTAEPVSKDCDPESPYYISAVHFRDLVLGVNPDCKVPKVESAFFTKWVKEVRLIHEADERKDFQEILAYCFADSFWRAIVLNPKKFREKYDTIKGQMLSRKGGPPSKPANKFHNFDGQIKTLTDAELAEKNRKKWEGK